jgi:hypothetical protein
MLKGGETYMTPLAVCAILTIGTSLAGEPTFEMTSSIATSEAESTLLMTAKATTWSDVLAYLDAHATTRNALIEEMLRQEAEAGVKTWACIVAYATRNPRPHSHISPLDGSGIGWPSIGLIRFGSESEMMAAAELIEDTTNNNAYSRNKSCH